MFGLSNICNYESRAITAENFKGEKGKGGMATEGTAEVWARELGQGWKVSPSVIIEPGQTFTLAEIDGPGIIRHIWMTHICPRNRSMIIRMYWDGSDTPSVETPLDDFFASAETRSPHLLSSLAVCVNPNTGLNSFWEMPFRKKCVMTVENICSEAVTLYYEVDYVLGEVPENCGYFHAQFRRSNPLKYKECHTILDGVKGNGHYVGTYMFRGVNNNGWWGEGEIKFFIDGDKEFPTICGTGTEDYFLGAFNFEADREYKEFCTPYSGLSKVIRPDGLYNANQRFSLYRWHICDPVYFKKDLKVTIQALGCRSGQRFLPLTDDISTVAYWYQDTVCKNFPKLPSPDELEII